MFGSSPPHSKTLTGAYRYAARNAPITAARWFNRFYDALQTLSENPQRCSFAPENANSKRELRQFLYGRKPNVFRAVFTIEGSTVWILRIRRATRRPLTQKELGDESDAADQ